jgi:nucleoside-diphosphate-sugar epimerase
MTARRQALVIGGTGPTGPFVVNGLCDRGFAVTMLHTGRHEHEDIPAAVEHVHTDPFDRGALEAALAERTFDVALVMYGRLREVAEVLVGKAGQVVTIGGVPAIDGYGNPHDLFPAGMPVPTYEHGPELDLHRPGPVNDKAAKILETEHAVFAAHPTATHLRYPVVYGPNQLLPREWMIVRRALDGRRHLILPDGGLYLGSAVYVANAAHAVLLCVDQPERAGGQLYHVSDETTFTLRQLVEVVSAAVGHTFEIVDLPYDLARPAYPLMMRTGSFHRYSPPAKLMLELGYRDRVKPVDGVTSTAQWLVAHPHEPGGSVEHALMDPFDYAAEDALIAAWSEARAALEAAATAADPYVVDRYAPGRDEMHQRRRAARRAATQAAPGC